LLISDLQMEVEGLKNRLAKSAEPKDDARSDFEET
jgi:FtsZ-binding cell division protein ZapB